MERTTFFFYGTLMDAAVLARVAGANITAARLRPAVLENYRRVRVADRQYPAVVPAAGHRVEGRLFRGASPEMQRRIAWYEDPTYQTRVETVIGPGRLRSAALVFVAGPKMRLSDEDWDFAAWCRVHRRPFLARLETWMRGYARANTPDA